MTGDAAADTFGLGSVVAATDGGGDAGAVEVGAEDSGAAPQAVSTRALASDAIVSLRDDITAYDASAASMCQPVTGVG